MRHKNHFVLIWGFALIFLLNAQATASSPDGYSDTLFKPYIPYNYRAAVPVPINLIFLQKSDGTGNFQANDDETNRLWDEIENNINALYSNLQEATSSSCIKWHDPFFKDTRIRFVFNRIYLRNEFYWNRSNDSHGVDATNTTFLHTLHDSLLSSSQFPKAINVFFTECDYRYNRADLPTYIEPSRSGGLVLGTSAKPLGTIYNTSTKSYTQSLASDRRIKQNIKNIDSISPKIRALRPITFDFDSTKVPLEYALRVNRVGFIAQEMKDIMPNLVNYDSTIDLYAIDYLSLIPYLVKSWQEQDCTISTLIENLHIQEEHIKILEQQVNQLTYLVEFLNRSDGHASFQTVSSNEVQPNTTYYKLHQNVPNPFNTTTSISYELINDTQHAQIIICNSNGKVIKCYDLPCVPFGVIELDNTTIPSGIYTYSLVVDGKHMDTKRLISIQ